MIPGFRRSLARRIGRTVVAVALVALVGQSGALNVTVTTAGSVSQVAPPTAAVGSAVSGRAVPDRGTGGPASTDPVSASGGAFRAVSAQDDGAAAVGPTDLAAATAGLEPSIQYEQAEEHAGDRTAFAAGGRVTVGFRPRPGDPWPVGGSVPTALPAGRLDGGAIRVQGAAASERASRTRPSVPPGGGASVPRGTATLAEIDQAAGPAATGTAAASFGDALDPAASDPTVVPAAPISLAGLRREIFGFLPYWELNASSLRLDYAKISTIAYFGVGADGAGNLQKRNADGTATVGWSGWASSKMTSVISAAHANHTRVVLTVQSFGWNATGLTRQKQLLGSATARTNLARQIAAAVRDRGADGVNLDFEPLAATYDAEFTALVRSIRTELNRIHAGYQVTFDTLGSVGNYPVAAATAPGGADAVFVMGYDYRTAGSTPVGSVAPLDRASGADIRGTVAAYVAVVPPSKVILGVPYYGRAWSTASGALNASNTSGAKFGASTTVVYDTAADYLAQYGHHYDSREAVAWTAYQRQNCTATYGCVTAWRELYVDDATAIGAKYDVINQYGLRGAGIWALGYDGARPELYDAIQRKFITDSTAPVSGVRILAPAQPNPAFPVSWVGRDDVAVASYDVQVSADGGPWTAWINATAAVSATWYGIDGHAYAFRVRARDPRGNTSAWNVTATAAAPTSALAVGGFGVVRTDGLATRSAPDTSATKTGSYAIGSTLYVTDGPRSADGYTWYQVRGPVKEWGAVTALTRAAWVATSGGGTTFVSPAKAPNATRVQAALGGLGFGGGGPASIGSAAAATAYRALSPNGDGSGDTLAINWTADRPMDSLALRVFRADGSAVGGVSISKLGAGAHQVLWNGRVGAATLPNGRYLVALAGTAGGATFANPSPGFQPSLLATFAVTVDTVAPTVTSASSTGGLISPNGDGILDAVTVRLAATGADHWLFNAAQISGASVGPTVTSGRGAGSSAAVTWTGRTASGSRVADGLYRLTLTALDAAGNHVSRSWTVRVDATPATVGPSAGPALFSPDGDGTLDATRLAWHANEAITGNARVYHGTTLIRTWTVGGATAGAVTWNGTDGAGRAVPDGHYAFVVTGRDAAGNLASASIGIAVDRTLSAVHWNRPAFYPQDGDALAPTAAIAFSLKRTATVSVGIYAGPTLIRTIWTNQAMAAGIHSWTWDGRDAHGALVQRGTYTARVVVRSTIGTTQISRPIIADAFDVSLSASTVRAGQTLTVTVTTTEPLRAAPTISFAQPGRAAVARTAIPLGGGRFRVSFTVAAGPAGPATIRIAGRDSAGGPNLTVRAVTVR